MDENHQALEPSHVSLPGSVARRTINSAGARYLKLGIEKAPNTVRAYRADLNCYNHWCEDQAKFHPDLAPFPASAEQVVNYLGDIAQHYKVATLQRRLAMLSSFHELQGFESPTGSKLVRTAMDGIKRELGIRQHQAPAFTLKAFQRVILSLDETVNAQLRDKVVLLLGFTGAFRRGELAALNVEDLVFDEEGILIDVLRSKTDQLGAGQLKAIFYASHPGLCPVRTVQRYLQRIDEVPDYAVPVSPNKDSFTPDVSTPDVSTPDVSTPDVSTPDVSTLGALGKESPVSPRPLLLRMRRGDRFGERRLTDQTINLIVTKHFGRRFSAHTLRASFVTVSKKNGASNSEIMAQTHHKTEAMIRRYTRFDDARTHNAGTKLGL